MKLSTDHIIKDVARETEEAMARLAAAAEADPNAEKPQNITEPVSLQTLQMTGCSLPHT